MLNDEKAIVTYLGHSGFGIKTRNNLLIFDYWQKVDSKKQKIVINKLLKSALEEDLNICFFVSHRHHDHFDKIIFSFSAINEKVKYFCGWKSKNPNFISIPPYTKTDIDNLKIITLKSTDEGSAFIVQEANLSVFHFGDLAYWTENSKVLYHKEINRLHKMNIKIDLAFFPIAYGSGGRAQSITDGAEYALETLEPKMAFPMHGGSNTMMYKDFFKEMKLRNFNIYCSEYIGQEFHFEK